MRWRWAIGAPRLRLSAHPELERALVRVLLPGTPRLRVGVVQQVIAEHGRLLQRGTVQRRTRHIEGILAVVVGHNVEHSSATVHAGHRGGHGDAQGSRRHGGRAKEEDVSGRHRVQTQHGERQPGAHSTVVIVAGDASRCDLVAVLHQPATPALGEVGASREQEEPHCEQIRLIPCPVEWIRKEVAKRPDAALPQVATAREEGLKVLSKGALGGPEGNEAVRVLGHEQAPLVRVALRVAGGQRVGRGRQSRTVEHLRRAARVGGGALPRAHEPLLRHPHVPVVHAPRRHGRLHGRVAGQRGQAAHGPVVERVLQRQ
mmetsp:Transcript_28878/g.94001  ORF Transcript_28878/g.94001 Transcript_28878/m.94001 type:complete len:316 (-) Transcript_28878:1603-2550(-)